MGLEGRPSYPSWVGPTGAPALVKAIRTAATTRHFSPKAALDAWASFQVRKNFLASRIPFHVEADYH